MIWRAIAFTVAAGAVRVAAAEPEPIRITYAAPAGCPGEADVVSRIEARASATRVPDGARTFALVVAPDPDGFRGTLSIDGGDGSTPTAREVTTATCDEVVGALVLVAVLAVQDRATTPAPAVAPALATTVLEPAPAPRSPAGDARWRLALGAGVARYSGMTPTARIGAPIYVAASRGHVRLRATFDTTTRDDGEMASFRWTAGRLEICPYALVAGRVELAPCAGMQVGALTGTGTATAQATSDTRPWLAPEAVARVAVRLGSVALELEGTAAAPLVRDRYYFAPASTVHQVPEVAFGVGTSIAVEFR